jgi:Heparinase II/III-like protein/Heparinase II/III N-terminus
LNGLRRRLDLLSRLGPRPILIARYFAYVAARHMRRRKLGTNYDRLVADPPQSGTLVPAVIDLSPFEELPGPLKDPALRMRAEAEEILAHRVDMLGSGWTSLGPAIDWHRDFKSGYRWPLSFFQNVQATRLTDASDAKVPWELSRCHHLLTLARAGRIFQDRRFANEVAEQLDAWLAGNPPGMGINWVNTMEVALRAVNWIAVIEALEPWEPLSDPLRSQVTRSLQVHGRHIAANLEGTPYLRSNHYLSDILGLLVLGASLTGDPDAPKWFRQAHGAFEREIRKEVHEDGIGFEASLSYHGLALEIFLLAYTVAERHGRPFSPRFRERLVRMVEASRALRHPDGRFPQIGDSDSGRVLPGGFGRGASLDQLVWLGAATLNLGRPFPQEPHEEVAWTLGIAAWQRLAQQPVAAPPSRTTFPDSGFYVLKSKGMHIVVRCGDVGQNGNGGHAHNDLFSFELSNGPSLIVDSGTYAYTSDPEARNQFRATASHNAIVVAETEINPMMKTGLFRLKQVAHPHVEAWEETSEHVRLAAWHDGYGRLSPGVIHRREFILDRMTDNFEVVDELVGQGVRDAKTYLHFPPDAAVTPTDDGGWLAERGCARGNIHFFGVEHVVLAEGWVSDRFGVRERAPVLVGLIEGPLPLRFGYRVEPLRVDAESSASELARAT